MSLSHITNTMAGTDARVKNLLPTFHHWLSQCLINRLFLLLWPSHTSAPSLHVTSIALKDLANHRGYMELTLHALSPDPRPKRYRLALLYSVIPSYQWQSMTVVRAGWSSLFD